MNKDVLVLSLDHIVPLGTHARHMAVYVYRFLVLHALQHGINHNEAASPAHARTDGEKRKNLYVFLFVQTIIMRWKEIINTKNKHAIRRTVEYSKIPGSLMFSLHLTAEHSASYHPGLVVLHLLTVTNYWGKLIYHYSIIIPSAN